MGYLAVQEKMADYKTAKLQLAAHELIEDWVFAGQDNKWDIDAWNDYIYWQAQDKKTLKRINLLIKDISRAPFEGIGMLEP